MKLLLRLVRFGSAGKHLVIPDMKLFGFFPVGEVKTLFLEIFSVRRFGNVG